MSGVWSEKLKGRHQLVDPGTDERTFEVNVNETGSKGVKWIKLAHEKD
jgi:hypothetical protein